jgi:hypothetical protein
MTANVSIDGGPATFVLIPGAGADPRVFDATIAALRELGHEGVAPPLPLDDPERPRRGGRRAPRAVARAARRRRPVARRLFPLAFQQRLARERIGSGEVAEIDGGHLPMLARPRELAERLVELA